VRTVGLWQTGAVSARQYESAAHRLRELIKEAGLRPGDKLPPERELADRLGVSRTSVRQALTLMRAVGAVEPRQGDGVYLRCRIDDLDDNVSAVRVGSLDQHQPAAVMEAREGLEIQLARLAARRRTVGAENLCHQVIFAPPPSNSQPPS